MPVPSPLDPEAVTALAKRLVCARDEVMTASGELLEHFVDVGDGATQLAVELLADHAADALRALDDALGERPPHRGSREGPAASRRLLRWTR